MKTSQKVFFITNYGSGAAEHVPLTCGTSLEEFFAQRMPGENVKNYMLRVNRAVVPPDHILHNGDRLTATVTNIFCHKSSNNPGKRIRGFSGGSTKLLKYAHGRYIPRKKPWQARIRYAGTRYSLGLYKTKKQADRAYATAVERIDQGLHPVLDETDLFLPAKRIDEGLHTVSEDMLLFPPEA